jgi:hypothetical protein
MIMALRQLGRPDGRNLYYQDRQYENVWSGGTSEWPQAGRLRPDRLFVGSCTLGVGSKYPVAFWDANGEFLNGLNTTSCASR